jgi:hypothetical protein
MNSDDFDLKIETLKNSVIEDHLSDYMISIKDEKYYCVGRVEMLNFNKITASIGVKKTAKYHQLFLNSMSYVLERFGGYSIKNVEGSMLYYFPESEKKDRRLGFMSCIECGLSMIQIHEEICKNAARHGLPKIDYSISADYGRVTVISTNGSRRVDLLGTPMDMCSKIIHQALSNEFIIGEDLYEIVKNYDDYHFKEDTNHSSKFEYDKRIYTVTRNKKTESEKNV